MNEKEIVLITGGSRGLGKAIAMELKNKYQVIITSEKESELKETASKLNIDYYVCDVSDYAQIDKAVSNISEKYGKIDVLINNAGIWIQGPLENNDPEYIKKTFEINTLGVVFMTRAVLPMMINKKSGTILIVNSVSGITTKPERTVYDSSKWALTGFTECLRQEVSKHRIKVLSLHPSLMNTAFFEKAGKLRDVQKAIEPKEVAKVVSYMLSVEGDNFLSQVVIRNLNY
ncbi:hypothetical protein A3F07_02750 [candidate division WWE3 bacterium RIFCSPHIGHO2_12_FULL_38_15]|uniref:Short-chain dehydrogenase n=1 Tax=candidate division WWE3 bacterium RIFCSPHIGHO2_02_FULL_38_14 TaxID=1802620 RepID=A0A1F4V9X2_UNCKA|nr:MAG: hypothetical protein A2793_04375 [candidate division WWE3 bacterium RIFCSPHIGHO2_01_FULL_38_45]OGC49333.1 MAG: hypothetical protein A3F07_02750 [candidate division WWE3 bacterium RIFCSPHIGHO2_12_FULL_38_15]OGC53936.1 MAG: hypothetical protein A3B64_02855 [candidate division WWE3 bacterium RIFCSPLOWO2_01_FULL_37_24]OGC54012.1 MAG: hypothetical protein A3D91_04590 [candidate division WWE3 bacterium RIFCSPHIGHO2_02_FULL_38_14]